LKGGSGGARVTHGTKSNMMIYRNGPGISSLIQGLEESYGFIELIKAQEGLKKSSSSE
jgi:hypothetical protein